MKTTLLSIAILALSATNGEARVQRHTFQTILPADPGIITLPESFGRIRFVKQKGSDEITVSLQLVSQDRQELREISDHLELEQKVENDITAIKLNSKNGDHAPYCAKIVIGGKYALLKGVCYDSVTIGLPADMKTNQVQLAPEQVASVLRLFTFDSYRTEALELLAPLAPAKAATYAAIAGIYTFDSDRSEARDILLPLP